MKKLVVALGLVAASAFSAEAGGVKFGKHMSDKIVHVNTAHAGVDCGSQNCVETEYVPGEITTHRTTEISAAEHRVEQVVKRTVIQPVDRTIVDTVERVVVVPIHETYYAPAQAEVIRGELRREVTWAPIESRNMPWTGPVDAQTCYCTYPMATNHFELY